MNETTWASQFEGLLAIYHWRWTHFRPARTTKGYRTPLSGYKGFPDYVAVKSGRLLFVELKGDGGDLSVDQREWQNDLRAAGATWVTLWPQDLELARDILAAPQAAQKEGG